MSRTDCVIYCSGDDCYWGPDARGYGPLSKAGRYTLEEATSLASNPERRDVVIPLEALQAGIETQIEGLRRLVI